MLNFSSFASRMKYKTCLYSVNTYCIIAIVSLELYGIKEKQSYNVLHLYIKQYKTSVFFYI